MRTMEYLVSLLDSARCAPVSREHRRYFSFGGGEGVDGRDGQESAEEGCTGVNRRDVTSIYLGLEDRA